MSHLTMTPALLSKALYPVGRRGVAACDTTDDLGRDGPSKITRTAHRACVLGWQESLTPLANLGGNSGLAE
jgi:hypothetical protein